MAAQMTTAHFHRVHFTTTTYYFFPEDIRPIIYMPKRRTLAPHKNTPSLVRCYFSSSRSGGGVIITKGWDRRMSEDDMLAWVWMGLCNCRTQGAGSVIWCILKDKWLRSIAGCQKEINQNCCMWGMLKTWNKKRMKQQSRVFFLVALS